MKRKIQIAYLALVLLLLLGAACVTILGRNDKLSIYENRTLEPMPELSLQSAANGSFFSKTESFLADHMAGRRTLQKVSAKLDMLLKRPVINNIVRTDKALLPYFEYSTISMEEIEAQAKRAAENLAQVEARVASYGGIYLYVAVPAQYTIFKDAYPSYLDNRFERYELEKDALFKNIPELTKRRARLFSLEGILDESDYSAVDHHFNIEGAKKAFDAICFLSARDLSLSTPLSPELADLPSLSDAQIPFKKLTLPSKMLGSRGKQLFGMGGFLESFSYMLPEVDIPYTRTDYRQPSQVPIVVLPTTESEWTEYIAFMGGDYGMTCIDTNRPELPTVLIYGDSFTNAIETLLYTRCNKMYSVDLRHCTESLGSIIDEIQPDFVICVRDYSALISTDGNGRGLE